MASVRLVALSMAACSAAVVPSALAQTVVYEQLPANPFNAISPFANVNEPHSGQMLADNFPLQDDAIVAEVEWWGASIHNGTGAEVGDLNLAAYRIQFFAADGVSTTGDLGFPGTLIAQEDISIGDITRTPGNPGPLAGGPTYVFRAALDTPVALAGGDTYWIAINAIVANPADPHIAVWFTEAIGNTTGDGRFAEEGRFSPVDGIWRRVGGGTSLEPAFRIIALDAVDTDGDGLFDDDEVNIHGTDPNNADTDGDGLQDGTEVTLAGEGECHDPLNADSDFDGLLDGEETFIGTDPCSADTDGDGLDDFFDPNPLDPDLASDLQAATLALADMIDEAPLDQFSGFSPNLRRAVRNVMAVEVRLAALIIGFDPDSLAAQILLELVLARVDGQSPPPDWMVAGPARDEIRSFIEAIIDAMN